MLCLCLLFTFFMQIIIREAIPAEKKRSMVRIQMRGSPSTALLSYTNPLVRLCLYNIHSPIIQSGYTYPIYIHQSFNQVKPIKYTFTNSLVRLYQYILILQSGSIYPMYIHQSFSQVLYIQYSYANPLVRLYLYNIHILILKLGCIYTIYIYQFFSQVVPMPQSYL